MGGPVCDVMHVMAGSSSDLIEQRLVEQTVYKFQLRARSRRLYHCYKVTSDCSSYLRLEAYGCHHLGGHSGADHS